MCLHIDEYTNAIMVHVCVDRKVCVIQTSVRDSKEWTLITEDCLHRHKPYRKSQGYAFLSINSIHNSMGARKSRSYINYDMYLSHIYAKYKLSQPWVQTGAAFVRHHPEVSLHQVYSTVTYTQLPIVYTQEWIHTTTTCTSVHRCLWQVGASLS